MIKDRAPIIKVWPTRQLWQNSATERNIRHLALNERCMRITVLCVSCMKSVLLCCIVKSSRKIVKSDSKKNSSEK